MQAVRIAQAAGAHADIVLFQGLGHSLSKVASPLKDEGGVMDESAVAVMINWLKKI